MTNKLTRITACTTIFAAIVGRRETLKSLVALMMMFPILILYGCKPSLPSEGDGKREFSVIISRNQEGLTVGSDVGRIKLVNFHKTNGQEQEMMGIKLYRMEFEYEIEFTRDCAWDGRSIDTYEPCTEMVSGILKCHPVKAGRRGTATAAITFEKMENGWRLQEYKYECLTTKAMQLISNGEMLCSQKKFNEAATIFQEAAELGDPEAQLMLGYLYKEGQGVPKDYGIAIKFFQRAADQGDHLALNNLAWLYATCPDKNYWNGPRAVEDALKAVAQCSKRWYYHGTLGAAYARNNQFEEAIVEQQRAIELMNDEWNLPNRNILIQEAKDRLVLYGKKQAFSEK
jgi:tetratricopeptide (TPR) repeat protein